jgi:hypothetical protein
VVTYVPRPRLRLLGRGWGRRGFIFPGLLRRPRYSGRAAPSSSGSLAILGAIPRASSFVSRFIVRRRPASSSK